MTAPLPLSRVLAAALGLVALPALAQVPAAAEAPATHGSIHGRVVPCPGVGLSEAELLVLQSDAPVATPRPDAQGRFGVSELAPGAYELLVTVPGCTPAAFRVSVAAGRDTPVQVELAAAEGIEETIEVQGQRLTSAEQRRISTEAVQVVELGRARQQSADLGEVLARSGGVVVQRTGGLGSAGRVSLNGLSGEQLRFFLDGVPLELAGFGLGLANVPVNLLERVEVYRGVVPVRFGADALGGAIHLVTANDEATEDGAAASLQAGSFGTLRGLAAGRVSRSGLFARGHVFGDLARNDYAVDVLVDDAQGRPQPARVPRFHDGYGAVGGGLDVGVTGARLADQLSLRLFGTGASKELQHGIVMSVPYGEAWTRERAAGALLRWAHAGLPAGLHAEAVGGYSRRVTDFRDLATAIYDWYGAPGFERRQPGELGLGPKDQAVRQHAAFARVHLTRPLSPDQQLRLTLAPTLVVRRGEDRVQQALGARDPLDAQRDLLTLMAGLEHELRLLQGQLESVTFLKGYVMRSSSEEVLSGDLRRRHDQRRERLGAGQGLRWLLGRGLMAKASYEWATRLPGADEIFGDGVLVGPNLQLAPEASHNLNVELSLSDLHTRAGSVRGGLAGFARLAHQLIVPLGNEAVSYQNVSAVRVLGTEVRAGWTSPGMGLLALDANATWEDVRNTSDSGPYAPFTGDRLPNRPWLTANATARLQRASLLREGDEASLQLASRYTHAFFRGWESVGLRDTKQRVAAQLTHGLTLGYVFAGAPRLSGTLEALNLTDATTYDFFGVQRPGRSFFLKVGAEL